MIKLKPLWFGFGTVVIACAVVLGQGGGRRHTATETQPLRLVPATEQPPSSPRALIDQNHGHVHVESNGVPKHLVGRFPNRGNPHAIRPQRYILDLPQDPQQADKPTSIYFQQVFGPPNMPFGVAVNGVLFDPGTAEFWQGDRRSGWNYEALGGAVPLGIDENYAHVQPQGAYHYHGIPSALLKELGYEVGKHSPLIGWGADGFPIYCRFGYRDGKDGSSEIIQLKPSYRLKSGERKSEAGGPTGKHDGTFVEDYEFVSGSGDLDECNGRFTITPEYPQGTYAYFLTDEWPVIPRAFRGTPVRLR